MKRYSVDDEDEVEEAGTSSASIRLTPIRSIRLVLWIVLAAVSAYLCFTFFLKTFNYNVIEVASSAAGHTTMLVGGFVIVKALDTCLRLMSEKRG